MVTEYVEVDGIPLSQFVEDEALSAEYKEVRLGVGNAAAHLNSPTHDSDEYGGERFREEVEEAAKVFKAASERMRWATNCPDCDTDMYLSCHRDMVVAQKFLFALLDKCE